MSNLRVTLRAGVAVVLATVGLAVGTAHADVTPPPPSAPPTGLKPPSTDPTSLCTIRGTSHNDVLRGRPGQRDVICGFGGNDTIYAAGGDIVIAGSGNDKIYAHDGAEDLIDGGPGRDGVRFDRHDLYHNVEYRF